MSKYCVKCGNSGYTMEGDICECGIVDELQEDDVSTLTIPSQYNSIVFNSSILPKDLSESYKIFMDQLYYDLINLRFKNKNLFLGAPAKHGKRVLSYCVMSKLHRRGIKVFPLLDIMEIRRILLDLDNAKNSPYLEDLEAKPIEILTCKYLFAIIPSETSYAVYDTIYQIVDRRTRRGNDTILIFNGTWNGFISNDSKGVVKALIGDGSFGTIQNKSFWYKESSNET